MKCGLITLLALVVAACGQDYKWVNFAGLPGTAGNVDGATGTSRLNGTYGADCDSSNNVYIADRVNNKIKKITPAGVVSTLSVSGLNLPTHVVVNKANGNLYVADHGNGAIKKITPSLTVTTIANITAIGLGVDSVTDTVYVGDMGNNTIKMITSGGSVSTIAGAGTQGSNDGALLSAKFNQPCGIAVDSVGNLLVADRDNSTIRKVDFYSGQVITVAGIALSPGCSDGPVGTSQLNKPTGITLGPDNNFYIADQDNFTIRKLTRAGVVTTVGGLCLSSGGADGVGSVARFGNLGAVGVDSAGNLFAADRNHRVSKGTPPNAPSAYAFTNFAGISGTSGDVDGATGTSRLAGTYGADCDGLGNIYIADRSNSKIKKITPAGVVSTLSVSGLNLPTHVVVNKANGNLYVADHGNGLIKKITPSLSVSTIGTITAIGLGVDSVTDTVYVGDMGNHTIKKITSGGSVSTVAGSGTQGSTDGALLSARFNDPCGIAVDATGNLFVADRNNHTVRKVDFYNGQVTTVAGSAGSSGCTDATGSSARFNQLTGITIGPDNNFYIADQDNFTIRKLGINGAVTTLGGLCGTSGGTDGVGSAARFGNIGAVGVDHFGQLFVADRSHRVSKGTPPSPPSADLKYLGFWPGSVAPGGSVIEQFGYANFSMQYGPGDASEQAVAQGMKILFFGPDFNDPNISTIISDMQSYGTNMMGIFTMDEPDCVAGGNTNTLEMLLDSIEDYIADLDVYFPNTPKVMTVGCAFWLYPNFRLPAGLDYVALECYGSVADPATTKSEWLSRISLIKTHMNGSQRLLLMPAANQDYGTESQLIQKASDIYNYATTDPTVIGVFPFCWYSFQYDCASAGVSCGNGVPAMNYSIPVIGSKSARDLPNLRAHYVQIGQLIMSGAPIN